MYWIELSDDERNEMLHVLRRHLAAQGTEIAHSGHRDFKEMLRHREALVEALAARVERASRVVSS